MRQIKFSNSFIAVEHCTSQLLATVHETKLPFRCNKQVKQVERNDKEAEYKDMKVEQLVFIRQHIYQIQ